MLMLSIAPTVHPSPRAGVSLKSRYVQTCARYFSCSVILLILVNGHFTKDSDVGRVFLFLNDSMYLFAWAFRPLLNHNTNGHFKVSFYTERIYGN